MYCGKCGTQIENNALFCPNCGKRTVNIDTSTQKQPNAKIKKIALPLGIVVGVVAVIVFIVLLISGGGYKKTLDNYYKAYATNDPELMYSTVIAQYWIDYTNEGWGNSAFESIQDDIEDELDDWDWGYYEDHGKWTVILAIEVLEAAEEGAVINTYNFRLDEDYPTTYISNEIA